MISTLVLLMAGCKSPVMTPATTEPTGDTSAPMVIDSGGEDTSTPPVLDGPCTPADFEGVTKLSQLRCMRTDDPTLPVQDFLFYEVNAPLWSDRADKRRWVYVPAESQIEVTDTDEWIFPIGTVFVKDFSLDGRLLETRFLVVIDDGPSKTYDFRWEPDRSDATLLWAQGFEEIGDQTWEYPAGTCNACHADQGADALGLETAQLNRPLSKEAGNQLDAFVERGWLPEGFGKGELPSLADPYGSADSVDRTRAWLHTNCAHCHPGEALLNLDYRTSFVDMNVCGELALNDLELPGLLVLAPGDPGRSSLWLRAQDRDTFGMPPLARDVVDVVGVDLLSAWISGLDGCD